MAVTTAKSAEAAALRPFTVEIPEADLDDLRRRVAATRWPDRETVPDRSQFPNLIYFHDAEAGGHFPAWEEPQLFSEEIRAAFRSLR